MVIIYFKMNCLQLLYSDTFFSSPKIWQSGEPCHSSGAKFKRSWQGRERSIEWTEYSEFSTTAQLREGRSFQEVRLPRAHHRRHHGHSRLLDGLADAASTRINLQRGGRHRQERGARSRSSPQVPTFFVLSLSWDLRLFSWSSGCTSETLCSRFFFLQLWVLGLRRRSSCSVLVYHSELNCTPVSLRIGVRMETCSSGF